MKHQMLQIFKCTIAALYDVRVILKCSSLLIDSQKFLLLVQSLLQQNAKFPIVVGQAQLVVMPQNRLFKQKLSASFVVCSNLQIACSVCFAAQKAYCFMNFDYNCFREMILFLSQVTTIKWFHLKSLMVCFLLIPTCNCIWSVSVLIYTDTRIVQKLW